MRSHRPVARPSGRWGFEIETRFPVCRRAPTTCSDRTVAPLPTEPAYCRPPRTILTNKNENEKIFCEGGSIFVAPWPWASTCQDVGCIWVSFFCSLPIKEAGSEHKHAVLCLNKVTVWSACAVYPSNITPNIRMSGGHINISVSVQV